MNAASFNFPTFSQPGLFNSMGQQVGSNGGTIGQTVGVNGIYNNDYLRFLHQQMMSGQLSPEQMPVAQGTLADAQGNSAGYHHFLSMMNRGIGQPQQLGLNVR